MPVHKNDTRFFYVNGSKKYFNGTTIYNTASFDSESENWSYSDQDTRFSTNTPVYYPLENGYIFGKDENGNTLPAPENYTALYFNTGIAPSPEETSYTFTIEDDEGLSSSIAISNKAKQLNPVSFSAEGNATYSADEDSGVYTLYISHDGLCTDGSSCGSVTIHYTVTEVNGNNVFAGGSTSSITASVNGKAVLNLPKGKYKIDSYAGKNYYIASDSSSVSDIRVVQSAYFYVAENGKDDENTGAKKSPFRTIQKAIDTFIQGISSGDFEADGMCNINLQTDLTVPEGFAFSENSNAFVNISSSDLASATINISGYSATRTINLSGITDNSAVKASAGTVNLENLSITGIGSSTDPCYALYIDGGKVTCSNCAITNNNGGVYNSGTLILKGKNTIYDNKNSEGKQNNVYLPYGKKIKINGDISGSKIGVSMPFDDGNKPTAGNSVTFTQDYGYGTTNTVKAGAIFIADNEYSVGTSDDKEAAFMVSGGSFYSAQDFNFSLSCLDSSGNAATGFYPNVAKTLTIKPTVTRKEAGTSTRQLYLNPGNNMLYTDETFETKAAGDNKVSWKAALYCYGEKHSDITVTSSASGINLTIPAISFEDTYTLKVTVTYLELSHDAEFVLDCSKNVSNAVGYIHSMTSSGTVIVEGSVSGEDLWALNNVIRNLTAEIKITLDLSGTDLAELTDSDLSSSEPKSFIYCTNLVGLILPDTLTKIGNSSLRMSGITSITIPSSVTTIGDAAFLECSLTSITIPSTVTTISGTHICGSNSSLQTAVLNCTAKLPNYAFLNCTALTTITISSNVTGIGTDCFKGCSKLTTINYSGTTEQWNSLTKNTGWNTNVPATVVHCSNGDATLQ